MSTRKKSNDSQISKSADFSLPEPLSESEIVSLRKNAKEAHEHALKRWGKEKKIRVEK